MGFADGARSILLEFKNHHCTPIFLVKFLDNKNNHDSFFTVNKVQEYFWDDNTAPKNFDLDELPNSFKLKPQFMETHGLYGIYTHKLIELKRRIGDLPMMVEIPKIESFDIDDYEDLEIIKHIYNDRY